MNTKQIAAIFLLGCELAGAAETRMGWRGERKLNNLVAELLAVTQVEEAHGSFTFTRSTPGWIFIAATCQGAARIALDEEGVIVHELGEAPRREAMRYVTKGEHTLQVERKGPFHVESLTVRAIPELIHCGLGFNPEIKSYGLYDLKFLQKDILPNVTTLMVPHHLQLSDAVIRDWHGQGKRFVAEVGVNSQGRTTEDHFNYWSSFYEKSPFLDGIIINEFIVNRPVSEWVPVMTPERRLRMDQERQQDQVYGEVFRKMRADPRFQKKTLYAYIGGSGKKLNQEVIGTNFVRALIDSGSKVALERYLHEMSSERGSQEALQLFTQGVADWEAREPGVTKQMVMVLGLFSMPPGGINKQPNVDYHVWMDQQMRIVANHPVLVGLAGLEWWTSTLADEETVRFVGKLYRHYALDGKTNLLTRDPLFLPHLQNADFEKGTEGWTLHPAVEGAIAAKSFPRYGRIEGRYMGLGRPADPEHIGDTFLWMKRNAQGPNTFAQTIRNLEPGRLYSMKMFSCDYHDLVEPKPKKIEEAKTICTVVIEGVEVDARRSFSEVYASNPEPKIPVAITYYWTVFRAKATTAKLTISDWPPANEEGLSFGQEQTFNFLEIQPYHE